MTVTVGIATTGEHPAVLLRTVLHAIDSATAVSADAEVLVVVNGRDAVPDLAVVNSPALRVVYVPQRNVAAARNLILAQARHDTVLFTDDDCTVPRGWCSQMSTALRTGTAPVVTAPVRMDVTGPISAYFDYQRLFDATPSGPDSSALVVTTNCGLRRDLVPESIRFDQRLSNAGEDTHFGLALTAAGIPIRHLTDAEPIRHGLPEDIRELTHRFIRNARSGPQLYLRCGYGEAAMPDALEFYRSRLRNGYRFDRRFAEIKAPQARTAFATFDAILVGCTLVGYLDALGSLLDHPLVELDTDGLDAAWARIADLLAESTDDLTAAQWADLDVDCRDIGAPGHDSEPLLDLVRAALDRYARPLATDPDGPAGDVLHRGIADQYAVSRRDMDELRAVWTRMLADGAPISPDAANRLARSLGLPFKVACDMIEMTALIEARPSRRRVEVRS